MSRDLTIKLTEPQAAFMALTEPYRALVAGYGTGKSELMADEAIIDASHSATALVSLYEPTYDLVRLIMAPRICEKLTHFGIRYKYNKSENVIYTSNGQFGDFILRTLDNPERIIGYQAYRAHIDELDTLKHEKAEEAWIKIIARTRQVPEGFTQENVVNKVSVYTTPEGFRFVYDRWVTNKNDLYGMVQAATSSNPYLPKGYIDSLKATYPAELIDAYLEGQFVNLNAGTVYRSYEPIEHNSTEVVKPGEAIYVGMDFNVDHMAATIYVKRDDVWHAVDEIKEAHNTPAVGDILKRRYPNRSITIYPDSSGKNRTTTSSVSTSDIDILRQEPYRFICRFKPSNPRVKDRINAMNAALEQGRVKINVKACPETSRCLTQQAYDKNGEPDKTTGVDHQNDATTYPIAYEMPIRKPIAGIRIGFKS